MTTAEFRKLVDSIRRAGEGVRGCHLETLQDAVADAIDEIEEAFSELEDVLPLEE